MSEAKDATTRQSKMPTSGAMIGTLGTVATISGVLLALVYQGTYDIIQRNREQALRQAVFTVIPGASEQVPFETTGPGTLERVTDQSAAEPRLFTGWSEDGKMLGVALKASEQGYGGPIRVLYGYDPDQEVITGLTVLESKETPGLGDRISEEPFLGKFTNLDANMNATGDALAHPITFVKRGEKTEPWQVEGISGATISSKAVVNAIQQNTREMLPFVHDHLDELKEAAP
ncbi:MAG: RnfABCDGE type electron transport complex subunit G [Planctomycetota bacterium]